MRLCGQSMKAYFFSPDIRTLHLLQRSDTCVLNRRPSMIDFIASLEGNPQHIVSFEIDGRKLMEDHQVSTSKKHGHLVSFCHIRRTVRDKDKNYPRVFIC